MSVPLVGDPLLGIPVGLSRDDRHNYFWRPSATDPAQGPIPSVTNILRVVDKSGPLVGWAKRITAEAALKYVADLPSWVKDFGAQQAASMLGAKATQERDASADMGTRVHVLAEQLSRGKDVVVTEEEAPFLEGYRAFLREWRPKFLAAEEMVMSESHAYAGTLDWIALIDGIPTIGDNKTSKGGPYMETALQLAAYARADWFGRPGVARKFRIPPVRQAAVLRLRPELPKGYELVPYAITEDTFLAFLKARALWGWLQGEAKQVIGKPMSPRLEEVVA